MINIKGLLSGQTDHEKLTILTLNNAQRGHLWFRLGSFTDCEFSTADSMVQFELEKYNSMPIYKIFMEFGKSERSAKIHARKVSKYKSKPRKTIKD